MTMLKGLAVIPSIAEQITGAVVPSMAERF